MQQSFDWKLGKRQPSTAIFIALLKALGGIGKMIWPLAIAFLLSKEGGRNSMKWVAIGGTIIGIGLIKSLFDFFYFRYGVTETALLVRKGFFKRTQIDVPLEKIQAVHLDQDWMHRLLQLTRVSVDSPGSANAEIQFSLEEKQANALRDQLLHQRLSGTVSEVPVVPAFPFFTLSGSDLMKLGISANFLRAFLILLVFVSSMMENVQVITGDRTMWWDWFGDQVAAGSAGTLALAGLLALLISVLVSFVLVVLRYGNFSLRKTEKGFHIQTGLINRKEKLVPYRKIQYMSWHANWIRRYLPYFIFNFHSIGEELSKDKWQVNVPITRKQWLNGLLEHYHPMVRTDGDALRLHFAYIIRMVLMSLFWSVVLFLILYNWLEGVAIGVFLLVPLSYFFARIYKSGVRIFIQPDALLIRKSIFGLGYTLLRWDKVQMMQLRQSRFQRRLQVATLILHTAGGRVVIPWQPIQTTNELLNYSAYKAEAIG